MRHARSLGELRLRVVLSAVVMILACGAPAEKAQQAPAERRYPLRGEVLGVDPEKGALRIAHEKIPGYMDAMTMRFPVLDRHVLEQVEAGDQVHATLVVAPDNRYWLVDLEVIGEVPLGPEDLEEEEEAQVPEGTRP